MLTTCQPPVSFVRDLHGYDAALRVRFGVHTKRWIIERRLPERNPQWVQERANPFGRGNRAKDLWLGWKEGYVHVLSVDRDLLNWQTVAPVLAEADMQQAGSWAKLNAKMDEAEAKWEAGIDREQKDWTEQASYAAYDHMAYFEGRRISMFDPGEVPAERHPDGFLIRDRRGAIKSSGVVSGVPGGSPSGGGEDRTGGVLTPGCLPAPRIPAEPPRLI